MKTDVSVPPSSRDRERFLECRFFSIYVRRNMREGTTTEMYCSEHVAFVVKAAAIVEPTIPKVPLATLMICAMMDFSMPLYSSMPAKVIATTVIDTVYIIP